MDNALMLLLSRAVLIAAAMAIVLLAQLSLPDEESWKANKHLLYASVGLLALQELLRHTGGGRHVDRVRRYEADMKAVLGGGLKAVATELGVSFDQVGVHAFLARGRWRLRKLANVGGLRLGTTPSLLRSDWRPGKGLAGRAWNTQNCEAADWRAITRRALAEGRAAWEGQPPDHTYRLTWAEIQLTRDYRGVVAAPVYDARHRLIGCVTVDAPLPVSKLIGDAMAGILSDVAVGVAAIGQPPLAWWGQRR